MLYKFLLLSVMTVMSTVGVSFAQTPSTSLDTKIQSAAVRIRSQGEPSVKAITQMLGAMKLNKKINTNQSTMYMVDGLLYHLHKDFFDQYFALAQQIAPLEKQLQDAYSQTTNREQTQQETKPIADRVDLLRSEMGTLRSAYELSFPPKKIYKGENERRYRDALVDVSWYFLPVIDRTISLGSLEYKLSPFPTMQPHGYRDGLYYFDYAMSVDWGDDMSESLWNAIRTNNESSYLVSTLNVKVLVGDHIVNVPYVLNKSFLPTGAEPSKRMLDERYLLVKNNDYEIKTSGPLSLELSKKIFNTYYTEEGGRLGYQNISAYEKSVKAITADMLPVFGTYRINDEYSLLYIYPPYAAEQPDGLGKPVIYSYDHLNRPNSVTVTLPQDAVFTYLKPLFNIDQGRSYQSRDGKVVVDGSTYDYLRYKAAVNNYQTNDRGRIVKGSDVAAFYDVKLDQLGFNKKEKADFVEYRVPKYASDKYYFISFKFNEQLDPYAKLTFALQPDSISRVLMETVELSNTNKQLYLDRQLAIDDLSHIQPIKRTGKHDIVERGGVFRAPNNERVFGEVQ